jgi:metacaspase-1
MSTSEKQKANTTVLYGLHFKEGYIADGAKKTKSVTKTTSTKSATPTKTQAPKPIQSTKPITQPAKPATQSAKPATITVTKSPSKPASPKPKDVTASPKPKESGTTLKPSKPKSISKTTGTKRALLIGINYIGTNNELNGCIKDIQNINNILTTHYQFKPENIKMLSDDQSANKPTKINIINNINEFVAATKPGDELFIHYSGHGTQIPDLDGDEAQNPDAKGMDDALCPCDFDNYDGIKGFISDDDLRKMIINKIPKGAKLRAFFDCCHSGSALDLPYMFKAGNDYSQIEPNVSQSDDCLLISGCKDFQTSADAYINKQYSGALTWALIQSLTSAAKVPTTWKELLLLVRHHLVAGKYSQIPMLSVGNKQIADIPIDL